MPKTKIIKLRVKAHALGTDDMIKIGGRMYRIVSVQPMGFGTNKLHFILRPTNVDNYHEQVTLSIPPLTKVTAYGPK